MIYTSKLYKKLLVFILFIISIIVIGLYINPLATGLDENYTLALINHSYLNIIHLDSMDVHPILYYFLVKFFIQITTFWTSYVPIKIISARLFSALIFVIIFFVLRKIIYYLHINNNICIEWISFLILPEILGTGDSQLVTIRMYGLASLFISLEFLNLLKFDITNHQENFILSVITAILATYTHYYAAMFSGLLLLIYCIKNFLMNKNNKANKLLIGCVILCVSFIPWSNIFFNQICNPNTYWMSHHEVLIDFLKFIILFLLFIYPWMLFIRNKAYKSNYLLGEQLIILISVIIPVFVFAIIYSAIKGSMFQVRYMMPVFLIYEFISINICIKYLQIELNNKKKIIPIMIILILLSSTCTCLKKQAYIERSAIITVQRYQLDTNKEINVKVKASDADNINVSSGILTTILFNHENIIIPKTSKHKFKSNLTIFNNPTYKYLFKDEINRIRFK